MAEKIDKYNKNDLKLLAILIEDQCVSKLKAYSKKTLLEKTSFSVSKLDKLIRKMITDQFIQEGARVGLFKTYFVTTEGIKLLKDYM